MDVTYCVVWGMCVFFFFKQKTAYEMRISDWSSDVCSSDLSRSASPRTVPRSSSRGAAGLMGKPPKRCCVIWERRQNMCLSISRRRMTCGQWSVWPSRNSDRYPCWSTTPVRSEEHTSLTPVPNVHLVCRLQLEKKKDGPARIYRMPLPQHRNRTHQ